MNKPLRLSKAEFLDYWAALPADQPVKPRPVAYKHSGSTYAEDSIRITGTRAFIDSVISRLQDLLVNENGFNRLQVVYQQTTDKETGRPIDAWNCYIQVHERGGQAQMVNAIYDILKGVQK